MLKSKEYIGFAVDNRSVDLAQVRVIGKTLRLLNLERIELVDPLNNRTMSSEKGASHSEQSRPSDSGDIFGLDAEDTGLAGGIEPTEEADPFADLESLESMEDLPDMDILDLEKEEVDLVDEAGRPDSNEILLYEYLSTLGNGKRQRIGLNIRSGVTLFQILSDADYRSYKRNDIKEIVEDRLLSVHGEIPGRDTYNYHVDKQNRLIIASLDHEPESLSLINRLHAISKRKRIYIDQILPDEMALVGFYRLHYSDAKDDNQITALIQFRENRSRILFMRGHQIIQISPVINEGIRDKSVLSTIFSKLLFQLDTGEVPGLDRIILCDNLLGNDATTYFTKHFPDVETREFLPDSTQLQIPESLQASVAQYTTALAIATASARPGSGHFPPLSIIPRYISDRQKIFQLQWHGILLLIAIGLTPIVLNHFYQQNQSELEDLTRESVLVETMIADLQQTVNETNAMEDLLNVHREQLMLLYELSEQTVRWTTTFDHINESIATVGGIWVTTFRHSPQGLLLEGFSLYEERIPQLARRFGQVTLVNVRNDELRERPLFRFSMRVARVVASEDLYTPEYSREILPFLESLEGI